MSKMLRNGLLFTLALTTTVRVVSLLEGDPQLTQELRPPVVDIGPLIHPYVASFEEGARVFEELSRASQRWGFYYIENHGISDILIQNLELQMQEFFSLPLEEKLKVRRREDNSRGYANDELTKRRLDLKEVYDFGPQAPNSLHNYSVSALRDAAIDGINQWVSSDILPEFQDIIQIYYDASRLLATKLMQSIARFLCCFAEVSYFDNEFHYHSSLFRLNHYPSDTNVLKVGQLTEELDGEGLGISRHTDAGALTILWQDPRYFGALEVYSGSKQDNNDGEWVPVDPLPGTLTVNNGDMLQVWTNGFFKAAEHRVRATSHMREQSSESSPTTSANKDIARLSAAFFLNPNYDTIVRPQLSCHLLPPSAFQGQKRVLSPARIRDSPFYKPIRWGDFRIQRFKGDYSDHGEEIQIEHFRVGMDDYPEDVVDPIKF